MIRRKRREMPGLNTASLPDLIFVVLFFFMIVTHMRTDTMKVKYDVPQGEELTTLKKKSTIIHVYIGKLTNGNGKGVGKPTEIQVGNKLVPADEVVDYLVRAKQTMAPEDKSKAVVSIHADRNAPMGIVAAVKMAARQAKIYNVCYSAREKNE